MCIFSFFLCIYESLKWTIISDIVDNINANILFLSLCTSHLFKLQLPIAKDKEEIMFELWWFA